MAGPVLALNCGSSSIKFALFGATLEVLRRGGVENIGAGLAPRLTLDGESPPLHPGLNDHASILAALLDLLGGGIRDLHAVGHRVVHGGTRFAGPVRIDAAVRDEIAALAPLAPSHQPHNLAGIDAVARIRSDLPQVAMFDTAFHRSIPEHRQLMPLPRRFAEEGLRRFGFHGISYESIVPRLPTVLGDRATGRVVICHLGNGCSLAGVVAGRCAYTSMGFTPLDGLVMGRRPGRLDPGAVLWLVRRHDGDAAAVDRLLNSEAGLLGISGVSSDMRTLLEDGGPDAELAIAMFVDRLAQEIGAAAAAIGGLDAIVFTGGIGENAAPIRARLLQQLAWLGFTLDEAANQRRDALITAAGRTPSAHVVFTEEELMIARAALALAGEPATQPGEATAASQATA